MRLQGTLRSVAHVFNDQRLIAALDDFPREQTSEGAALSPEQVTHFRRKHRIDAWYGSGALYGTREEVAAAAKVVTRALRRVPGAGPVLFLNDWRMQVAERLGRLLSALGIPRLGRRVAKLRVLYDLLKGKPSAECLRGARWRARPSTSASSDPLDQNAGMLWLSPVLPMTGPHVDRVNAQVRSLFARYGFEYQLTFSCVTDRALCAVMTIAYDRADPAQSNRAVACHEEVLDTLMSAGYVPYRAGNLSMARLDQSSRVFWDVAADIKAALDPHGIISPGHYEPRRAHRE